MGVQVIKMRVRRTSADAGVIHFLNPYRKVTERLKTKRIICLLTSSELDLTFGKALGPKK